MSSVARYIRHAPALVAQMDRALDFESSGRGFESSPARHPVFLSAAFGCSLVCDGGETLNCSLGFWPSASASKIGLATSLADRYTLPTRALVAQLDRVLDYESRGRGFESSPARHLFNLFKIVWNDLNFGREESQPLLCGVARRGVVRQVAGTRASIAARIVERQERDADNSNGP